MLTDRIKIVGAFLLLCGFFACADKKAHDVPEDQLLARVGDRYITAEEFRHSFEFSPAPLRYGTNPRKTYLDYMIKELLLANEGYRLNLHKTPYVQSRLRRRRYNDLLEAFHLKHVHAKVDLAEEEIREATLKSTVKWRMIIWPTASLPEAERAFAEATKTDLTDFIDRQLAQQEVRRTDKSQFETDWLDYLELPPEILAKIVDIEMGKPSRPFPYGDGYAIAQVLDIHREGILEDELAYGPRRQKMKERLHNIQADRIAHALMDSIITPMDVRVRGLVAQDLTPPLYEWVQSGLPDGRSLFAELEKARASRPCLAQINNMLDEELVSYAGGRKRVRDFIDYVDYNRAVFNQSESFEDFQSRVITEIGRMMKNDIFVELAEKEGFADSAAIREDLRLWEQKWAYDIYRNHTLLDVQVSEQEMHDFIRTRWRELGIADVDTTRFYKYQNDAHNAVLHEKQLARLESDLERLRQRYDVWINEELLNSIELVDDMPTNRTSYFIRKNFNFEAVMPTVDMKWANL
ncbi:hypothetical protein JXA02_09385 [candidate division KSB1 bacterium]|nr:hypothetical protein [candidate division KSB1 bacterium]RQW04530.1 MAG: hypothetical protein EH222_11080 [candidate division KSB1 bacterium]